MEDNSFIKNAQKRLSKYPSLSYSLYTDNNDGNKFSQIERIIEEKYKKEIEKNTKDVKQEMDSSTHNNTINHNIKSNIIHNHNIVKNECEEMNKSKHEEIFDTSFFNNTAVNHKETNKDKPKSKFNFKSKEKVVFKTENNVSDNVKILDNSKNNEKKQDQENLYSKLENHRLNSIMSKNNKSISNSKINMKNNKKKKGKNKPNNIPLIRNIQRDPEQEFKEKYWNIIPNNEDYINYKDKFPQQSILKRIGEVIIDKTNYFKFYSEILIDDKFIRIEGDNGEIMLRQNEKISDVNSFNILYDFLKRRIAIYNCKITYIKFSIDTAIFVFFCKNN